MNIKELVSSISEGKYSALIDLGSSTEVRSLAKESDPRVAKALALLTTLANEIETKRAKAIRDFRKNYLKVVGKSSFDTMVKDNIVEIYTTIATKYGLEEIAGREWK